METTFSFILFNTDMSKHILCYNILHNYMLCTSKIIEIITQKMFNISNFGTYYLELPQPLTFLLFRSLPSLPLSQLPSPGPSPTPSPPLPTPPPLLKCSPMRFPFTPSSTMLLTTTTTTLPTPKDVMVTRHPALIGLPFPTPAHRYESKRQSYMLCISTSFWVLAAPKN